MLMTIVGAVAVAVASAVMGIIGKAVQDWSSRKKEQSVKHEGIEALRVGIAKAQQEFVDGAKALAAKDNISKEDFKAALKNAETLAKQTALRLATGPAGEWLVEIGTEAVGGLIDWILAGNKKDAK